MQEIDSILMFLMFLIFFNELFVLENLNGFNCCRSGFPFCYLEFCLLSSLPRVYYSRRFSETLYPFRVHWYFYLNWT
jgi:hypothetical protein